MCFLCYICDIFRLFPLFLSLAFKKYLSIYIIHSNEAHYHAFHVCALKETAISGIQGNKIKWYNFQAGGRGAEKSVSKIFGVLRVCGLFDFGFCLFVCCGGLWFGFCPTPGRQYPLLCHLKFPVQQSTCLFRKPPQGKALILSFFFNRTFSAYRVTIVF